MGKEIATPARPLMRVSEWQACAFLLEIPWGISKKDKTPIIGFIDFGIEIHIILIRIQEI